ncbi:MAG: hypothetical protein PVJ38_02400 [Candidatus Bathyarchaeota archaeon]
MSDKESPQHILPEHPKVFVEKGTVIIVNEDGSRIIWGNEKDLETAKRAADEIEIGLRAISYIRAQLKETLMGVLTELGATALSQETLQEFLGESLLDAYRDLPRLVKEHTR